MQRPCTQRPLRLHTVQGVGAGYVQTLGKRLAQLGGRGFSSGEETPLGPTSLHADLATSTPATPLVLQITEGIRTLIDARTLKPGAAALIRAFASKHAVSVFTVADAYKPETRWRRACSSRAHSGFLSSVAEQAMVDPRRQPGI